ncbi:MAG: hypothetical protein HYT85_11105 [candidate division NC10 bacterium]|nr:hypothetical protein [candidate division NC10 bacterium]MBI2115617.1 hypothetical protein [candidate division NC10 bacterium]MBI2458269.1 hypothetical protein [candidate division NC10 bacterium]MBI2561291.1 hypothetical protein [candidate division NC10 bacterium]MBI3084695.1 hypothetical protein [candidate division NC10 bacterium]
MTIVELMVVVLVIGILAAMGIVQYRRLIDDSRQAVAVSNLVTINKAQQNYYTQNDRFAASLDVLQLYFSGAYSYQIVTADAESFVAQAQYGNSVITINQKGALSYSTVASSGAAPAVSSEATPSPTPSSSPSKGPPAVPPGKSK